MIKKFKIILFMLAVLMLPVLFSCDADRVFEKNITLTNNQWNITDTASFITAVHDTSLFYDILVNVRTGKDYPNSNLFVFIKVEAPSGNTVSDTIEIKLADKSGKWYGSGLGDLSFISVPYKTMVRFGVPGIYKFKLIQGMRTNALNDVYNVGLRIQKSTPANQS